MARPMFRVEPKLPATAMQTYAILAPVATHWRAASCEEAGCGAFLRGWTTTVDEGTELGQRQAHYIRHDRTRGYTESRTEVGLTTFIFAPGTRCFRSVDHRLPVGKPEIYVQREGDWRGNPRGTGPRQFQRPADWVDHFAEHQDRLATRLGQG